MDIALKDMKLIRDALRERAGRLEASASRMKSGTLSGLLELRPLFKEVADCRRLADTFDELILRQ